MEVIYFIIGSLWVVVAYTAFKNHQIKGEYTKLKLDLEDTQYEFERHTMGISEEIDDIHCKLDSIETKLKEDSYNNIAEVNKQLSELNKMSNAMNIRFGEANKIAEKQLSAAFSEIQQLKNNIKALNQDPNILNR